MSRNSRRLPWVPTATISSARRSCARRNATSSLVPAESHFDVRDPQTLEACPPRRPAVRIGVKHDVGRDPPVPLDELQGPVGDAVHVPDDDLRLIAGIEQRVRASVHADEHGLDVADVGTEGGEVFPVAVAADHDEDVAAGEGVTKLGEAGAAEEQIALLSHVLEGVACEALEALVHGLTGRLHVAQDRGSVLPTPTASNRSPARRRSSSTRTGSPSRTFWSTSGPPGRPAGCLPPRGSLGPRLG